MYLVKVIVRSQVCFYVLWSSCEQPWGCLFWVWRVSSLTPESVVFLAPVKEGGVMCLSSGLWAERLSAAPLGPSLSPGLLLCLWQPSSSLFLLQPLGAWCSYWPYTRLCCSLPVHRWCSLKFSGVSVLFWSSTFRLKLNRLFAHTLGGVGHHASKPGPQL